MGKVIFITVKEGFITLLINNSAQMKRTAVLHFVFVYLLFSIYIQGAATRVS